MKNFDHENVNFWTVLRNRRSRRFYKPDPIPENLLDKLTEAAQTAPRAGTRQTVSCHFTLEAESISRMARLSAQAWNRLLQTDEQRGCLAELVPYSQNFSWLDQAPVVAVLARKTPPAFLVELLGELAPAIFGDEVSGAMAARM